MKGHKSEFVKVNISKSIGDVSVIAIIPTSCEALLVLAHGSGAGMKHPFLEQLAIDLANESIGTIRYNFPYMENGKRRPDLPAIAEKTVDAICEWTHQKFDSTPIFVGGKSFGGRMSSQLLSKKCPAFVKGIIFYGFPLHGIGKESTDRAAHLKLITIPMLLLQGTKDKLAKKELIAEVCGQLPTAVLRFFDGADHSFKVSKKLPLPNLAESTAEWIRMLLAKKK